MSSFIRPTLVKSNNIVSSEIKKCLLPQREFDETDINKFIELKTILDDSIKTEVEKKNT